MLSGQKKIKLTLMGLNQFSFKFRDALNLLHTFNSWKTFPEGEQKL